MLKGGRLGLAGGILWSLCMFVCTILAMYTGYSYSFLTLFKEIYPGYSVSWGGAFLGLVYGFFDAFIGLYLFAFIYNRLGKK
ncbi:MAG: bacteriophage holin [Chlamydiales bacterium]|nr:bacteriophage holin [Chlamydiales bacterium]